ncbi:MAG: hypothetical protein Q4C59_08870 [Lachnospiraceae bacterium]|nr:hypothetical protein [Lachnospiraceae bacterium]
MNQDQYDLNMKRCISVDDQELSFECVKEADSTDDSVFYYGFRL